MALLVLVIQPLQKRDERLTPLVDAIEERFRPLSNLSLLVLLMTGVVQTSDDTNYGGLLNFETGWSRAILFKHIAFMSMVIIVVFLQFGLAPTLERARLLESRSPSSSDLVMLRNRQRRLIQLNFALGLVILVFTAIATSY